MLMSLTNFIEKLLIKEVRGISCVTINGELYHYGIKGMKWGVRRFQNQNGTLTSAGRKRYADDPRVKKSKDAYDEARSIRKAASKAYDKAYTKVSLIGTSKNVRELKKASKELDSANKKYAKAKFDYKTEKETARIADKGITFDNKSKHRQKLESKYQEMGLSKEQAEAAANNRIKTERLLAASAAVTVTACAAYYMHSKHKTKVDGIIKSGENLQRIEMQDTNGKLHDVFYTSKGEHDNKRYAGLLGATRKKQTGHAYMMELEASKDIKVASQDKAAKIFGALYKNDPDFRSKVEEHTKQHFNGANKVKDINNLSDRNIRKMYENFNANILHIKDSGSGADEKFFNKMKQAGYGAIQDINDMKYSGYNAKNPLIVFGNSHNIMVKSMTEMKGDLDKAANKEQIKIVGEIVGKYYGERIGALSAVGLTTAAAVTYVSDPTDYREEKDKK